MSAVADRALVITRVFAAPRALVFRAWTDPRHAVRWWGPEHHPAVRLEMDARPGGAWRGCLRSTDTGEELWQHGVFRDVVEPERLCFTFVWDNRGDRSVETVVTVTFEEQDGRTRMTMCHDGLLSDEERDGHGAGWSSSFNRLEACLEERMQTSRAAASG